MRRLISAMSALSLLCCISAAQAGYHKNSDGVYVDDDGQVIEELWDDEADIVIFNGVLQKQEHVDGSSGSGSTANTTGATGDGAIVVNSSDGATDPLAGLTRNADGSLTVESGQIQIEDSTESSGPHLTQAEWAARWAKYSAANGTTTGTVYMDDYGAVQPCKIESVGLGRSAIVVNGEEKLVPTSSLKWDTEAPEEKVLAVVTPSKQSYITLRAKKSQKAFVMGHCEKCKVLMVIATGNTWTMVDDNGVRGYVLTAGLTFYDNSPRAYAEGIITVKGKTPSGNTVHVRSANSNNAKQIAEYPVGTPITIFSQDEKWTEVDVEGLHCWIKNEFVTIQKPMIAAEANAEAASASE